MVWEEERCLDLLVVVVGRHVLFRSWRGLSDEGTGCICDNVLAGL